MHYSEKFPEPSQTSRVELFEKIVNSFQPLTIFVKIVWICHEYACVIFLMKSFNLNSFHSDFRINGWCVKVFVSVMHEIYSAFDCCASLETWRGFTDTS